MRGVRLGLRRARGARVDQMYARSGRPDIGRGEGRGKRRVDRRARRISKRSWYREGRTTLPREVSISDKGSEWAANKP